MQIPVHEANLELGVIGNGSFGALVDARGRVVWSCLPAFDGDPAFCALLSPRDHDGGDFGIERAFDDHGLVAADERGDRAPRVAEFLKHRQLRQCFAVP